MMRYSSDTGGLLIYIGIGLTAANWISLAAMTLLPLVAIGVGNDPGITESATSGPIHIKV